MIRLFAFAAVLLFVAYGVAQVIAAQAGLALFVGAGWAVVIVLAALMLRLSFVMTLAAFWGAYKVWSWHWLGAALFAMPSLLLLIPQVGMGLLGLLALITGGRVGKSAWTVSVNVPPTVHSDNGPRNEKRVN